MTSLFVEFWQHECCGEDFAVGDAVTWPVTPVDGQGLVSLLGAAVGEPLRLAVERHQDDVGTFTGTVRSIRAVFHRLEPVAEHPDGTYHRALAGSAQLRYVKRTRRREWLEDLEWAGYVVEMSVDAEPPGPSTLSRRAE